MATTGKRALQSLINKQRTYGIDMILFHRFFVYFLAFPIMLMVTLIQWLGVFLVSFSAVFFNLLAGVLFLVSIMAYFMGLDTGKEVLRMLGISFIVFIIPHIGEWIVERIVIANYALRDFIKS